MTLTFLYWFCCLCWLLFSGWGWRGTEPGRAGPVWGGGLLLFLMLIIIGLKLFGFPIKG